MDHLKHVSAVVVFFCFFKYNRSLSKICNIGRLW